MAAFTITAMFSLRNWRTPQLVLATLLYWIVLGAATLGSPVIKFLRLSNGEGNTGSASLNFENGRFVATIIESGNTAWTGSAGPLAIALLMTVPPLILVLLWLRARPARALDSDLNLRASSGAPALRQPDPEFSSRKGESATESAKREPPQHG